MSTTTCELHDRVAVITFSNPPVNGLGHAVRSELLAAIDRANADDRVVGIVITGAGKAFSAGADIREFNTPKTFAEPALNTLIRAIEANAKPIVAALGGTCMGGGLELAMGCHYRVADASAAIALPEVKLGLMPGAGGTQRLPRAIGLEGALNMIVSGTTLRARDLESTSLFDGVVDGPPLEAAIALARAASTRDLPCKRLREVTVQHPNAEAFLQFARNSVAASAKNLPAPLACVEALAASVTMPFDEGMRTERRLFMQLLGSPESRALRHVFFAERAAARIEGVADATPARTVDRVGIVGAGTMGSGIALAFLNADIPVVLVEAQAEALARGQATISAAIEAGVAKGKVAGEAAGRRLAMLETSLEFAALASCDLVVEAVFESMEVKREVFAKLDRLTKPGAMLATNTSTLDVDEIAAATRRPEDVLGMHFFSPAQVMRLVEVVRGRHTAPDALVGAMQVARRLGKTAVVARVCDGFIGNRMIEPYLRQAMFLVDEGASPAQVDAALERFGMAMGPFRMSDLAGLDIGWQIRKRRYVERPQVRYSRIADRLCEAGRFGQKTGAGWYRYAAGSREAGHDGAVDAIIAHYRTEIGMRARSIGEEEIVDRCILALVNEGARVLDEGIAQRASDIDVVYVTGYGFPRFRGGPMLHADQIGLFNVLRRMRALATAPRGDREFWTPAPLLQRLADEGATFNG
jgi:3-hydroxyacyl-CoA dehydrogenase